MSPGRVRLSKGRAKDAHLHSEEADELEDANMSLLSQLLAVLQLARVTCQSDLQEAALPPRTTAGGL